MKWEHSNKIGQTAGESEENDQDELDYSPWQTKKITSYIPELFKTKFVLMWIGIGLLALIFIYVVMLVPRSKQTADVNQIKNLEARLQNVEDRLIEFKRIDEKIAWLANQDRKIDRLSGRVANLESAITKNPGKIPTVKSKVDVGKGVKRTAVKPDTKKTSPQYYQVKAGDTLYSISRRFGLTVDQLRRLNKLAPKASIYPGQKLLIKP